MTETTFPQCRIVTHRLLNPDTVERLLNKFFNIHGIRRMVLNGPRLPTVIPSGPSKGIPNPHGMRRTITVGNQELTLQVHVGTILLELENRDAIPALKNACDDVFTEFPYRLSEGRYMKTEPTLVDYAKYGPNADKEMLGLADPSSRTGPIILQGTK
ncbi:MAG: Methyl-coenzyme M reductase I operon protein D [Methanoregula sp. PtaU1.Bin051]|nr:MAG: Methyl-coenzyme M reductase I operon protein D [Methanoregula sp. PtaU1.Bin051]